MHVTAALITSKGRLFVAQRPPWKRFGLLWEFPGGKVEPGEEWENSLVREIMEELCLEVGIRGFFKTISHETEDFSIDLHAYWCTVLSGTLCLKEHIACKWARVPELKNLNLTVADRLLIPFLEQIPELPDDGGTHGTACLPVASGDPD